MSAFRNVNVPSGGSFRINNIPLPSINDTSTGLTDVLSASKVYSLVINSVAEYSGYQISQNNVLSSAYTVYATKQGKLITLTFPNINTTLNATDDIISFVMPNSLHAVSEMIETCYVNDQPCKFTLTPTLMGWYIRILKNPISNFIVGLNNIKTFTISYLGLNDTLLTDSVWGTALPDFVSPTVTLSIASGGLMSAIGDTRTINIVFSEPVIDFIESDITLTGLTLSAYTFGSTTASFTATSTANFCSVIINAGVCRDAAFNLNTVSNNLDVKTVPPLVINTFAIQSGGLLDTNTATRTIDIVFSQPVVNFDISDFNFTNGVLSNFTGSGDTYTVDFTATSDGAYTIDILPNNYTYSGVLGPASSVLSLGYIGAFNMVNSDYGVFTRGSRYSMFKHNSSYTNSAVQISSTNTGANNLTDIGFVDDKLDLVAYDSFIATYGTAYLSTFYDQVSTRDIVYTTRPTFMKNGNTYPRPIYNGAALSNSLSIGNLMGNCSNGLYIKFKTPSAPTGNTITIFGATSSDSRDVKINPTGNLFATLRGYASVPTSLAVSANSICDGGVHEIQMWQYGTTSTNTDEIWLDGVRILTKAGSTNGSTPANVDIGSNYTGEIYALFIHAGPTSNLTSLSQNSTTRSNFTNMFNSIVTELN
jgi:hypothetical protein